MIDLSQYLTQVKYRSTPERHEIYCHIRRSWMMRTPEEVVRQTAILHLINIGYSPALIAVERQFKINQRIKRFDIAVADQQSRWVILVECKAPKYTINQEVIDQLGTYNMALHVPILWATNGLTHHLFQIDFDTKAYLQLELLPLPHG